MKVELRSSAIRDLSREMGDKEELMNAFQQRRINEW